MSQGKFSSPRPHREEEREMEKAYRDLTRKKTHKTYEHKVTAEDLARAAQPLPTEEALPDIPIPGESTEAFPSQEAFPEMFPNPDAAASPVPSAAEEDRQIEEAFRKVTGQKVTPRSRVGATFDAIPEKPDFSPEETKPEKKSGTQPQWLGEVLEFYQQNSRLVLAALCAVSVMVIVFVILLFARSAKDPYGSKILSNVYIADLNVGGMTKTEAVSALTEAFGSVYDTEDMVIDISGTELRLTPKDSGVAFDAAGAVEEAYAYGRTGTQSERDAAYKASKTQMHNIAILPYLNLKTTNIRKLLTETAGKPGSTLVQSTYGLEGAEPELSADRFDKNAPTQTLVITIGKPGVGFDPEDVYNQVLDAYSQRVFLVTVENVETLREPDPLDLEKIYKEYCVEPVNASIDPGTGKTTPGSYGYAFDKEAARKLLETAQFGEEIRIPMAFIEPEIADANAFFRDTLGEYQTRYTSNDNRTANLRIACDAIHNRVLNPGEGLSFRDVVGQLSTGRGFTSAPEDTGMESTVGGGVTQVSSTLYCAALLSDLTVTARTNLAQMPSFIGNGLDAATNLTIKNTLSYPVRISAQVTGGYVKIRILGTEQRDYYRMLGSDITQTYQAETEKKVFPYENAEGHADGDVLQEGRDGYQVKSYTVRYDRATDRRISSDYVATSTYDAVKRIIASVEKPEETTPPTQPPQPTAPATEPATEPTTEPTTEPATESTESRTPDPGTDTSESGQTPPEDQQTPAA